MTKMKKLAGFSLIEMAMVLLVAGIIASLTLPLLTTTQSLQRQKTTEANKQALFSVLAGYVLTHEHLPSPSLPTHQGKSKQNISIGIIPYQEVGIPESMARDGYGNWFTYVVNSNLADPRNIMGGTSGGGQKFCRREEGKAIQLESLSGISAFVASGRKGSDYIAVILISHGPKGTGAFQATQDERRSIPMGKEVENSNDDLKFYFKNSTDNDPKFEHQVFWVTRNNLMAIYAQKSCSGFSERPANEEPSRRDLSVNSSSTNLSKSSTWNSSSNSLRDDAKGTSNLDALLGR